MEAHLEVQVLKRRQLEEEEVIEKEWRRGLEANDTCRKSSE